MVIHQFAHEQWAQLAAAFIQNRIDWVVEQRNRCSVVLTGGRTARRLYAAWAEVPAFAAASNVDFFFSDERCVPFDHPESNYGMAMRTLFRKGVPRGCKVYPMAGGNPEQEIAAKNYEETLPYPVDILLLGLGEDGHVASLFPDSDALKETDRRVMAVKGPRFPRERLTITPPVIASAVETIVFATGRVRAAIVDELLGDQENRYYVPARLAVRGTWLLETAAATSARIGCSGFPHA